jgi:hypothetical protein
MVAIATIKHSYNTHKRVVIALEPEEYGYSVHADGEPVESPELSTFVIAWDYAMASWRSPIWDMQMTDAGDAIQEAFDAGAENAQGIKNAMEDGEWLRDAKIEQAVAEDIHDLIH